MTVQVFELKIQFEFVPGWHWKILLTAAVSYHIVFADRLKQHHNQHGR